MSQIRTNSIVSAAGLGVSFPSGISGIADPNIFRLSPQVISFSPEPNAIGVSTTSNINITFDQTIQFSGSGTITLRTGSSTGTIVESYVCGSSARLSINSSILTIDPTNDLNLGVDYFVVFPSVGIANTFGSYFIGTNTSYKFRTVNPAFSITGGTEFTRADPASPTGFYKYHAFTSTGPLVLTGPSANLINSTLLMVGGGGGGGSYPSGGSGGGGGAGGVLNINNFVLSAGSYTVTIGAGGAGHSPTTPSTSPAGKGQDTLIAPTSSPTNTLFNAYGGGYGYYGPRSPGVKDGGSGGGFFGIYGPSGASYIGLGFLSQGNPGGSSSGPQPVGTGGGGAGTFGGDATSFPVPPAVNGPGLGFRGGFGGSGRSVTQFSSPVLSGNVPTIPAPSLTKIGPTGLYGGGGGGGAGEWPSPPSVISAVTAGAGGPGGGGHGAYVNPSYTSFTRSTPSDNIAENGYQNTGGGGGGNRGPSGSYPAGNGGSGIVMIRYTTPSL